MDLFDYMREQNMEKESPLAARLRPTTLDEVVGQKHIIGKDKLLYRAIKADKLGSVIFYGPPGTGKTYHAVLKAMEIVTFKQMFSDYLRSRKEKYSEEVLNEYVKHIEKINTECLKSDNIFRYYDLQKYKRLEEEILAGDYINGDEVRKNENSYYRHALKRYEEFLSDMRYEDV